MGIDYDEALLDIATANSSQAWILYDFNTDTEDIAQQLIALHHVTHVFIYLVPKQLALPTVRHIITALCHAGIVVCCYKFHPTYLEVTAEDVLMDLIILAPPQNKHKIEGCGPKTVLESAL